MAHRLIGIIDEKILFRDIGDILGIVIFSEQMIEGLVLARPDVLGDGEVPFLGIRECRIDIENHTPEREQAVLDHLANSEFCGAQITFHRS